MKFYFLFIEKIKIIHFLIILLIFPKPSCVVSNLISNNVDDAISHTDYLMTIYSSTTRKPCFYFSESRFSQPESSLINCTWYKTNACCKRTEVASVFLTMYTLNQASEACMNMMNYMMCFFCSPDQYIWYRGTQVSVCLKFCEELHDKCKNAEYNGSLISDRYKDGKTFCEAQFFKVVESNQQCFDFDPTPFSQSNKLKFSFKIMFLFFSNFFLFYSSFNL